MLLLLELLLELLLLLLLSAAASVFTTTCAVVASEAAAEAAAAAAHFTRCKPELLLCRARAALVQRSGIIAATGVGSAAWTQRCPEACAAQRDQHGVHAASASQLHDAPRARWRARAAQWDQQDVLPAGANQLHDAPRGGGARWRVSRGCSRRPGGAPHRCLRTAARRSQVAVAVARQERLSWLRKLWRKIWRTRKIRESGDVKEEQR